MTQVHSHQDGRAHFDGMMVRIPRPMDVGTFTDCRKMPIADLARFLDVPPATLATDGAGRVSYVARNNVMTSEYRDRYRDVVRAGGGRFDSFLQNPGPRHGMLQLSHGFTSAPHPALGRVTNLTRTTSASGALAIAGDFEFHSAPLALEIAQLMEGRFIRAGSIGFQPEDGGIRIIDQAGVPVQNADPADYGYGGLPDGWGYEFTSWSLLEHSIVTVPANPEALGKSAAELRRAFLEMPNVSKVMGLDRPRMVSVPAMGTATFHKAACPGGHCPGCSGEYAEPAMPEEDAKPEEKAQPVGESAVDVVDKVLRLSSLEWSERANEIHKYLHEIQFGRDVEAMSAAATKAIDAIYGDYDGSTARSIAIATAARALKETSVEKCPECLEPVAYHRPSKEFLAHSHGGKRCIGKVLATEPAGPLVKDVIKAGKVLRKELENLAACAHSDVTKILEAAKASSKPEPADEATSDESATEPTPAKAATPNADPAHREAVTATDALSPELVAVLAQALAD